MTSNDIIFIWKINTLLKGVRYYCCHTIIPLIIIIAVVDIFICLYLYFFPVPINTYITAKNILEEPGGWHHSPGAQEIYSAEKVQKV